MFFKISEFNEYGKLARLDSKNLKTGARVEEDEYDNIEDDSSQTETDTE